MTLQLQLEPNSQKVQRAPKERLSTVFFIGNYFYVFRDQHGRQLAFTQREFKLIKSHLKAIDLVIEDAKLLDGVKEASIIYDFVHHKFKLVGTNKDVAQYQIDVDLHFQRLNEATANIRFHVVDKPVSSKKDESSTSETYKERLQDTSKGMRPEDIRQYMEDFTKGKKITHIVDKYEKDPKKADSYKHTPPEINYNELKKQDFVFITFAKDGHATALVFDIKNKRGYYYDPASKSIKHSDRKHAKELCDEMREKLGIKKEVTSNPKDHQNGDHHCGRYILNLYKQMAEYPNEFNFNTFCNKEDRTIDDVIDYLLEEKPETITRTPISTLTPQGLTNTKNDCFLNAMFQSIITSGESEYYRDANNLNDPNDEKGKELHRQFVHLMNEYKKGNKPPTNVFRPLLGFNNNGQHDITEALTNFMQPYKSHSSVITMNVGEAIEMKNTLKRRAAELTGPHLYISPQLTEYNALGNQADKIAYYRDPPETFTVNGSIYRLQSLMTHQGDDASNGSYIAHVKHNNKWYECHNSTVTPAQNALDGAKDAYVLHYIRDEINAAAGG